MESNDNNLKIIITSHDDLLLAKELARMLVERRAAACVNLIPNVTSIFHWEKSLQVETEIIMLIKTTGAKAAEVQALLEAHHPYEVPEIVQLDGDVLHEPYMEWVRDCLL